MLDFFNYITNFCFYFKDMLTDEQKDAIASVLITQKFEKGKTIVYEGDSADSYHIIKEVY